MLALTQRIGEFVATLRFEAIPASAAEIVRNGFTDVAACIILGRDAPVVRALRSVSSITPQGGEARICFTAEGAPAGEAALINGAAAHAHDYDDVGIGVHPAHPSAVLVPAILAEAEPLRRDGRAMIQAYVAGYEVWGELARRDSSPHHVKGWHATGIFGALAAAAAVANLRGLDAERATHAIGIAASQAAGLVANFGSMTKPFHAGRAAQAGVQSARLAGAGMTAAPNVIENRTGFLQAFSPQGRVDLTSPPIFGREWWILRHGLGFKLYPMCYGAHRSLDGMLDLVAAHDVAPEDVADIEVEMSPNQPLNLISHDPQTALAAKFSEEFAMAAAIVARRVTTAELSDAFVQRDDVRALMKKVRITTIAAVGDDRPTTPPDDRVTVTLRDGRRLHRKLDFPRGHPGRGLEGKDLWTKFMDCVRGALPDPSARVLFERLQDLDRLKSVDDLPPIDCTAEPTSTMPLAARTV